MISETVQGEGLTKFTTETAADFFLGRGIDSLVVGRIVVREELTGLTLDESLPFLQHHFTKKKTERICEQGLRILFERSRGIPGLIVPMFRKLLAENTTNKLIEPLTIDDTLQRWESDHRLNSLSRASGSPSSGRLPAVGRD